jgi:hypothetical protein
VIAVPIRPDMRRTALAGMEGGVARHPLRVFTGEEGSAPLDLANPDHDRRAPLRRLETSFSQGAEWKALISKYIGTIPLSGDASCAAEQSISGGPPPRSSAMIAKVGAAARHSQSAAPRAAALPLPAQAPAVSRWVAIIVVPQY